MDLHGTDKQTAGAKKVLKNDLVKKSGNETKHGNVDRIPATKIPKSGEGRREQIPKSGEEKRVQLEMVP